MNDPYGHQQVVGNQNTTTSYLITICLVGHNNPAAIFSLHSQQLVRATCNYRGPKQTVPRSTVPCGSVPWSTVPCGSVPRSTVPCGSVPRSTVPCGSVPWSTVPCGSVPRSTQHTYMCICMCTCPHVYVCMCIGVCLCTSDTVQRTNP